MTPREGIGQLVLVTAVGGARGAGALAAALAVAAAGEGRAVLLVDVGDRARTRRPTMFASASARRLEQELDGLSAGAAARGLLCHLALGDGEAALDRAAEALASARGCAAAVIHLPPPLWVPALGHPGLRPVGAVLRAELPRDRALVALAVRDLRRHGVLARVARRPLPWAAARRALAGVPPGGREAAAPRRWAGVLLGPRRERNRGRRPASRSPSTASGQALPALVGGIAILLLGTLAIVSIAAALTGKGRVQRLADLAAISAARSMRDDMPRLTAPPRLPGGTLNPAHLGRRAYLDRARGAALAAGRANGADPRRLRVAFPDRRELPPLRVRVAVLAELESRPDIRVSAFAVAEAGPAAGGEAELPPQASGGGYSGPLAYRQGEGMRPDVAVGFDRMAAAASRAGLALVVNSGFRSDAEQAQLFAQNPDPTWVAPPGHSLHRCATELDLGPSGAYGWLAANARRFGFVRRYSWEPWHFGFVAGPPPCSAGAEGGGAGGLDGAAASPGLPAYVPERFRATLLRSAARWNVSAALLAAQLMAESGFDPGAVSPAGAQGIAQFMPATAASFGLRDPFDAEAAIDAQAHLMSDLLRRFGSVRLALAAYNAGPGAVTACGCVPDYPETIAYVARILALLDGSGALILPPFEVRLVA